MFVFLLVCTSVFFSIITVKSNQKYKQKRKQTQIFMKRKHRNAHKHTQECKKTETTNKNSTTKENMTYANRQKPEKTQL